MNKPTDYPITPAKNDADIPTADITLGLLRDRVSEHKPVTDEMIQIARTKLETAYADSNNAPATPPKSKLSSIRERFKAN